MKTLFQSFFLALAASLTLSACVDLQFDEPPVDGEIPDITANTSIAELKALHTMGQFEEITDDLIIEGVIIADDRSGNFYKTLVIQDGTAGIELKLNATDLYNFYPIGRRIYVKCQGLWLGDYNNLTQLGGGTYLDDGDLRLAGIEEVLMKDYVVGGQRNQSVTPKLTSIDALSDADVSMLIELEGVELTDAQAGLPYADGSNNITLNRTIEDCEGRSLTLRNSGYADFANELMPTGNGSIVGVFSVFGNSKQMFIRELTDMNMTGERCGSSVSGDPITIAEIRALFSGSATTAPSGRKISGVVISDYQNANITGRNLFIQDGTAGIVVRFAETHAFALGTQLEVNVSGLEISEFNGLLQLNNVPNNNAADLGPGTLPTPQVLSIAQITGSNFEAYESTLVKIEGVEISKSSGSTYSGVTTLTDATGSMDMFTTSYSSFANANFPSGQVSITGIVAQGGSTQSKQINLRSTSDVVGGSTGGGDELLFEDFQGLATGDDISLAGWTNVAKQGTQKWRVATFSGNNYAQVNPYQTTDAVVEAWLITPGLDLTEDAFLNFSSQVAFYDHAAVKVYIAEDFDGSDINDATWVQLNPTLANGSSGNYTAVDSGNLSLSAYTGETVHIAFVYVGSGTNAGEDTLFRVDEVRVAAQ